VLTPPAAAARDAMLRVALSCLEAAFLLTPRATSMHGHDIAACQVEQQ
jgi:hypothetical protein